ncbi:MAG TPA: leucyl aminopeptidase [Dehalococcoidia bacterium]|nr:leucyl aminopeptidase [Dehalococcoidia bacterium]
MATRKDSAAELTPSAARKVEIRVAGSPPARATVGIPVAISGAVPADIGLTRDLLRAAGFDANVGQAVLLPRRGGRNIVAVGIGAPAELNAARLRDAAAAFARAAGKHSPRLATSLTDVASVEPAIAGQAVTEGVLLARYNYELKSQPSEPALTDLTLVAAKDRLDAVKKGAERGTVLAGAAMLARDLANAPPAYLTAMKMAEVATRVARGRRLEVEIFDEPALQQMGAGGLLGVNAGSAEPPALVKLTYTPRARGRNATTNGHLIMVGKGCMYDSGGISLKPSDEVHATMKQDMSGAAAILGAMSALSALDCRTKVTGYLCCTDNMPSGSATKLGDVLTIYGGKTVEVMNTDAEGRLLMADALVLATEENPDAIVDIATLTGACLRALGPKIAGVMGNNQALIEQVSVAAAETDEPVWELPMERSYRSTLNSEIADIKNMGGPNGAAIHAALFLEDFIGGLPWAHLDIAGPVLVDSDESWRPKGSSGFGARLLVELALDFSPPNGATAEATS